jgi:hypothetical protein
VFSTNDMINEVFNRALEALSVGLIENHQDNRGFSGAA